MGLGAYHLMILRQNVLRTVERSERIRSGTNAEFHLVDERIVGHKPRSLGFAEAAALPLTSITAWEALFDRMDIRKPVAGAAPAVLIIGVSFSHCHRAIGPYFQRSSSCKRASVAPSKPLSTA